MSKTIILYWMRGTGKSSVWKELSEKLNFDFIDLDKYIAEKNNLDLSKFIDKVGWDKFRDEENKCLKEVLANNLGYPQGAPLQNISGKIISLWWWTVVFERNREELFKDKNTKIIYLNTDIEKIAERILEDEKSWDIRNSLTWKNVLEELKEVFEERKDIYKNNCDFEVDNNWKIEETVNQIISKLNYWGVCVPIIKLDKIKEFYKEIKNNRKIEFIELRLDLIFKKSPLLIKEGLGVVEQIIKECPKKVICTNRAKFEWWEFEWTCEESLEILKKCLDFWSDYIDIELETLERIWNKSPLLIKEGQGVVISHHNFNETPDLDFLKNILEKMWKYSPAVYKIAVMPQVKEDVETIYELNDCFKENFNNFPIIPFNKGDEHKEIYNSKEGFSPLNIFISMWKFWEETRINLAKRWNLLTFATYWDNISAPGQINYKELHKKIFTTKEVLFLWWPQISWSFSPFMHNFSSNKLKIEENKFIYKLEKKEEPKIIHHPSGASFNSKGSKISEYFVDKLESDEKYLWGNVTMPYKIDVYNYLKKIDRLEKNAKMVGAVNTLYKKEWKIYWTNTDLEWISWPILEKLNLSTEGFNPLKYCVYILWAGWASRAAISASIKMWIKNIYVLNRGQKNLDEIKNHFEKFLWEEQKIITKIYDIVAHPQPLPIKEGRGKFIIINTLPFWFKENLPKTPIKFENLEKILPNLELYFEAVYDSGKWDTPIVEKILSTEGFSPLICRWIEMLIWQAKTWFELWSNWWEFRSEEIKNILF